MMRQRRIAQKLYKIGQQTNDRDLEIRANIRLGRLQQYQGEYSNALMTFGTAVVFYAQAQEQTRLGTA